MANVIANRSEEQRKLQVTGGSTYILSLPKDWVKRNHLMKGNLIIVCEEDDGSLSLYPSTFETLEKRDEALIRVPVNEKLETIIRKAISAYLVGYNLLHIRTEGQQPLSTSLRNNLKNFARNYLVGAEIVADSPTDLTLQVLLNYTELSVRSALRRMAIIAVSMHKDAVSSLANLDYSTAEAVVETDREVNRFSLYVVRLLKLAVSNPRIVQEIGLENPRECLGYRLIAKSVERTADHATKIAENIILLKNPVDAELLQRIDKLSGLAISMFENAIEALFSHNYDQAENTIEKISQTRKLEKEAVLSTRTVNIEEIPNVRLLIESIRRTAEYASDISEVVLNLNIESVLT